MTGVQTGTLHLAGGRRVGGMPPGVAVLTPPLNPAQGRERETFVMLLSMGEGDPSRLYREIREVAAQAFWSTPGSVTGALRRAVDSANRFLYRYAAEQSALDRQRRRAALSCAAIKPGEFFLVQAGPACACILSGEHVESHPQYDLPPLGTGPYTEMDLTYLSIRRGDTLLLASSGFGALVAQDAIRRVLGMGAVEMVLDGLEQIAAGETLTALVLRWQEEEAAVAQLPRRQLAPQPAATPLPISPAVQELPSESLRPSFAPVEPAGLDDAFAQEPVEDEFADEVQPPEQLEEEWPEEQEVPTWQPARRDRTASPSLLNKLRLGDRLRALGRGVATAAGAAGGGLQALFWRMLPGRAGDGRARLRERRPPPPENPRLLAGVALAILFLVALVTALTWFSYGHVARRQQALTAAQRYLAQAQQSGSPDEQRGYWLAALGELTGVGDDAEVAQLRAQAQAALDQLDKIIWLQPTRLYQFGADVSIRRLVAHGLNVFFLDVQRQQVAQLTLTETGDQIVGGVAPAILQGGAEQAGQRISNLIDVTWNRPGGGWGSDNLVILDAEKRLWVYDPAWAENTYFLPLGSASGEGTPAAMAAFDGRLYILDPQANQVWRYLPRAGGYPDRAEPYFPTGAPQSLASARDVAIDGNVYILDSGGGLAKYLEGAIVPFQVAGVPSPPTHFVALAVDAGLTNGPVYLADDAGERVVILDSEGRFRAQLRAAPDAAPGAFKSLRALALDDAGGRLFFLTADGLYVAALPNIP